MKIVKTIIFDSVITHPDPQLPIREILAKTGIPKSTGSNLLEKLIKFGKCREIYVDPNLCNRDKRRILREVSNTDFSSSEIKNIS